MENGCTKMIPEEVKVIMQKLLDNKFEAYIIGGAVRDFKLKVEPRDYDIFTNATGEQILELFPKGKILGSEERQQKILTIIYKDIEISQYRKNGDRTETGKSFPAHISTCDFTINAMAMDINGAITDYQGQGFRDIENKEICFVGNAFQRIKEDPLRIMRGVRFKEKFDLKYFPGVKHKLMTHKEELLKLPKERIREELLKIILLPGGFKGLNSLGILPMIMTKLESLRGLEGGDYHNEPVEDHLFYALEKAITITDNPILQLGIYAHDIGKGDAKSIEEDGKLHFYKHQIDGADYMEEWMTMHKFSKEDMEYILFIIREHMYSYKDDPSKKSYIKFFKKMEDAKVPIEDFVMMLYCDHQANLAKPRMKFGDFMRDNWLHKKYYELKFTKEPFSVKDLVVSGKDVLQFGIEPGPIVGEILNYVFDRIMDGELKNERPELMKLLKVFIKTNYKINGGKKK